MKSTKMALCKLCKTITMVHICKFKDEKDPKKFNYEYFCQLCIDDIEEEHRVGAD